jgi:uncharacterized membrane protein
LQESAPIDNMPVDEEKKERAWTIGLTVSLLVLLGIWLGVTPTGWWEKIRLLGYAVCHQIEARSFFYHDMQSPLCARCTGMYLGGVLSVAFQARMGRRGKFPPVWVMVILGLLFLWFGLDGLNSFLHFFPAFIHGYQPTNLLRLVTGTGVGLGIGAILTPLFNQTAWADWINESFFEKWWSFFVLVLVLGLMVWGVYSQTAVVLLPAMLLSGLSVLFLLGAVHTVLALMILKRSNKQVNWQQMRVPVLLGLNVAMAQILATSLLRFWLTGTWQGLGF